MQGYPFVELRIGLPLRFAPLQARNPDSSSLSTIGPRVLRGPDGSMPLLVYFLLFFALAKNQLFSNFHLIQINEIYKIEYLNDKFMF